jgi:hypothetical protein
MKAEMKTFFTLALGATVGAVAYHLLVTTAEKVVETVVVS